MIWFDMKVDPPVESKQYLVCWLNEDCPPDTIYKVARWASTEEWLETPAKYIPPTHWAYLDFPITENLAIQWNK